MKEFLGVGESLTFYSLIVDFAIASLFLLIGQWIRAKVRIVQKFFLPASILAGFMGLFLGQHFLNVLPFSGAQSQYTTYLIVIVFTIVGVDGFDLQKRGETGGQVLRDLIGFQCYRGVTFFLQFIIPFVATFLIIQKIWPDVSNGFAIICAAGFQGGPGTAAAVGSTFAELGWNEATDLGITSATIGILTGIFGGLAYIKWGTKKGITNFVKDFNQIDEDTRRGIISKANRESIGDDTMSVVSLDTLTFHLGIILTVAIAGCFLNKFLGAYVLSGIPDFTVAYLLGLVFSIVAKKFTKLYDYYESGITNKISCTCTDYLVFFGIATINPQVVIKYAGPLVIMAITGIICCVVVVVPFANLMIRHNWFEKSMFVFGYCTGVFANSFILLRMCDPKYESGCVEDIAATPLMSFVEVFCWAFMPAMLLNGQGWLIVGICTAATIACIVISIAVGSWYPKLPLVRRD